jgi:PTS system ascorbate-specific IIA component
MLSTAQRLLGHCELNTQCVDIPVDIEADYFLSKLKDQLSTLDQGQGVLILTDAFGATPSNIACSLTGSANVEVVSGLNLPMLIRICNYRRDNVKIFPDTIEQQRAEL